MRIPASSSVRCRRLGALKRRTSARLVRRGQRIALASRLRILCTGRYCTPLVATGGRTQRWASLGPFTWNMGSWLGSYSLSVSEPCTKCMDSDGEATLAAPLGREAISDPGKSRALESLTLYCAL